MPDLSVGCCYSPHWEDTFADLDRETQAKPMWAGDIRKGLRAPRACPGPGYQEPEAQTLSWVWDEGSSDDDDDDDAVLEGVGLVFCKSQCDYSDPPSLDGLCDDSFAP